MKSLTNLLLSFLIISCQNNTERQPFAQLRERPSSINLESKKPYERFFKDGLSFQFDYPIGNINGKGSYTSTQNNQTYNGWYIATETGEHYSLGIHTGEDWNGVGGGNTDLGQPVYSISNGTVIHAKDEGAPWGNTVIIEHIYIENAKLDTIFSVYAHLDKIEVKKSEMVEHRQMIGTIGDGHGSFPAHLHLEIRKNNMRDLSPTYWPSSYEKSDQWVSDHYFAPSTFIDDHRKLAKPDKLAHLLVAYKSDYKMYYFQNGQLNTTYEIAISQFPEGHKQAKGDLKLPEGAYKIIQKSRGPFSGSVADYFGVAWMRLNYPNNFDANEAYESGRITKSQLAQIKSANEKGDEPLRNTGLGAGIGIHGWAGDWDLKGSRNITWGCISMLNDDLNKLYPLVPEGTPIFICP